MAAAKIHYEAVDASPVKSFFVTMFTRDIKLEDAILDLLDNCVDGILRKRKSANGSKPYAGFWAHIDFKKDMFSISDNCGGIPWSLHDYAFRMGRAVDRPTDTPGTVGVYGIGMKRAIFKMGRECLISTQNGRHRYEVEITPEWIADEKRWTIPVKPARRAMPEDGTTIVIGNLYKNIAARFGDDAELFESTLREAVSTHYAFIIEKGFEIVINKTSVIAQPAKLVFSEKIKPYMFRTAVDGVDVFLTVGFTRPIPSEAEVMDAQEETKWSSLAAGWTVICNDRAVIYCDRTELTGWGEARIPRYHTQFIAISGVVEFRSKDPSKLPTTTTKRGIDASSPLYLQVKNKMREGMKIFIEYTNSWRGRVEESKRHITGVPLALREIRDKAASLPFTKTRVFPPGEQYRPQLPMPEALEKKRRISYVKSAEEVEAVAFHLFEDGDVDPSTVGERCFDLILQEAES